MRFSYAESMTDPTYYLPLAKAAEAAGYASFIIPDSICYPEVSDSTYPYTPDGKRDFLEDKPFIEPFIADPGDGRGDRDAALHDLRGEAADPAPGAGGQAGRRRSPS